MGVKETWVSYKECDRLILRGCEGSPRDAGWKRLFLTRESGCYWGWLSWVQAQLCLTLCDPMECNPPGSSVLGIFQARILERLAISFSRGSSPPRDGTRVSRISYIGKGCSLPLHHQGSPNIVIERETYKDR